MLTRMLTYADVIQIFRSRTAHSAQPDSESSSKEGTREPARAGGGRGGGGDGDNLSEKRHSVSGVQCLRLHNLALDDLVRMLMYANGC